MNENKWYKGNGNPEQEGEHMSDSKYHQGQSSHEDVFHGLCHGEILGDGVVLRKHDVQEDCGDDGKSEQESADGMEEGEESEQGHANDEIVVEKDFDIMANSELGL